MRHLMWQRFTVLLLVATFLAPFHAWGGSSPLGTARAARGVKATLDKGTTWLELKGNALPVFSGTEVRSAGGSAAIELKDGSRIEVLPFSAVQFEQANGDPRVSLTYGRVSFNIHPQSKIQIVTPVARLDSAESGPVSGEVFVTGSGVMGLKMAEGRLNVHPTTPGGQTMVASVDPVFIPKRPTGSGPLFAVDGPIAPPAGAKAVFSPAGESVGYIAPDGGLAIHPGFTSDLTQPFSPKLVRLALNTIQDSDQRDDATPLFDVNGSYVGFLSGPVFFAQTNGFGQTNASTNKDDNNHDRPAGAPLPGGGSSISSRAALGLGAVAIVGGAGAALAGGFSGGGSSRSGASAAPPLPRPATPLAPR
jgi:FecR protein